MRCPICNNGMEQYHEEPTYSKNKNIFYTRTRYVCRKDDIWGRLEIPQQKHDKTDAGKGTAPTLVP